MRNLPDERRAGVSLLPPGAQVRFSAIPEPATRRFRCLRSNERFEPPRVADLRELIAAAARTRSRFSGGNASGRYRQDGRAWAIRCNVRCGDSLDDSRAARDPIRQDALRARCTVTRFLLLDPEHMGDCRVGSAELNRFRQFAMRYPFHADVSRYLQAYLLLRLQQRGGSSSESIRSAWESFALAEQQRMLGRVRAALRRLLRRMSRSGSGEPS